MKVQCPKCAFTGNVADELIPDQGRYVGCPKCRERFLIQKPVTDSFEILGIPDAEIPESRPSIPKQSPIGPVRPIPPEEVYSDPQAVPPQERQRARQPRRSYWNAGGCIGLAAIVIFALIVWSVVSPNSTKTPTKTEDRIIETPPSEVPAQPEVIAPSETEVSFPETITTEEEPTDELRPSYYEDDGTPVFGEDTLKRSNDSNVEITGNTTKDQPLTSGLDDETVYITRTGECYHRSGCSYLRSSKIPISKSEAISRGYRPCSRCNP